ncbi:MAG: FG-GAP-like repeat-containing protein [Desulfobacterales bacterium]|jgi:hypothetical protein
MFLSSLKKSKGKGLFFKLGLFLWTAIFFMDSSSEAEAISGGRVWTARSLSALQTALAAAEPKDVISLDPALHIDLDAVGTLVIPAGVTLCGGRNEDNDGAVLTAQLADGDKWPLLVSGGPNIWLERMRLIGPSGSTAPINKFGRGIAILHPGAVVAECEFAQFTHAAVDVQAPDATVRDNQFHHNRRDHFGYGVMVRDDAHALIEENEFWDNRHAIAGTGRPGCSYIARRNLVASNPTGHAFDMHNWSESNSFCRPGPDCDPYHESCAGNLAGDYVVIEDNTFYNTEYASIRLRGIPGQLSYIRDNCTAAGSAWWLLQDNYYVGPGCNRSVSLNTRRDNLVVSGNSVANNSCGVPSGIETRARRCADLIARTTAGKLVIYEGDCDGGYKRQNLEIGHGWGVFDWLGTVNDWNGDGCADVIARNPNGKLYLYQGNCNFGWRQTGIKIGHGWQVFDTLMTSPDFDGDGCADVIARKPDGDLFLYPGTCAGRFRKPQRIGWGWQVFDMLLAVPDWNGDGCSDVIARDPAGRLWMYPGNCAGGFGRRTPIGHGWAGFDDILALPDWDGDGCTDLIARTGSGALWMYPGNCRGGFKEPEQIGCGWQVFDMLLGSADFSGN